MLIIRGTQDIFISRADTKNIGVNLIEKTAEGTADYEMADDECLIFKIWDKDFHGVVRAVRSDYGSSVIHITPGLTVGLDGAYAYSVDLIYSNGVKETIIGQKPTSAPKFVVLEA